MIDLILAKHNLTVKPLFPPLPAEAATAIDPDIYSGISCSDAGRHVSEWCDGCLHERELRGLARFQTIGPDDITEAALFAAFEDEIFGEVFGD